MEFRQANQGSLPVCWGTLNCSARNAGDSGLISRRGGSLIVFLELLRQLVVYSQVMAGMAIQNSWLFIDFRTPV